jgi:hypothetical protein
MIRASLAVTLVLILTALTSGCGMFNRVDYHYHRTFTTGKELTDLKEALEKRIISETEYDKMKATIVKGQIDEKK